MTDDRDDTHTLQEELERPPSDAAAPEEVAPKDVAEREPDANEIVKGRALHGGASVAHSNVIGTGGEIGFSEPWDDRPRSEDEAAAGREERTEQ